MVRNCKPIFFKYLISPLEHIRVTYTMIVMFIFSVQHLCAQNAGTVDTSFGINGISSLSQEGLDEIFGLSRDGEDKLYFMQNKFLQITRTTIDGIADSSYGNNAKAIINGS